MALYDVIQTRAGASAIRDTILTNSVLSVSHIAIGDGVLPDGEDPASRTALVREIKRLPVQSLSNGADGIRVTARLATDSISADILQREIGLYNGDTLLAYGNAGDRYDFIPAAGSNAAMVKVISVRLNIGNLATKYVELDSTDLVTYEAMQQRLDEVATHGVQVSGSLVYDANSELAMSGQAVAQAVAAHSGNTSAHLSQGERAMYNLFMQGVLWVPGQTGHVTISGQNGEGVCMSSAGYMGRVEVRDSGVLITSARNPQWLDSGGGDLLYYDIVTTKTLTATNSTIAAIDSRIDELAHTMQPALATEHSTGRGTREDNYSCSVLATAYVSHGYLASVSIQSRAATATAGTRWLAVYQQPQGGGDDPAAWELLGISTNGVQQVAGSASTWYFSGVLLAGDRPIALIVADTADGHNGDDVQMGSATLPRPAGDTTSRVTVKQWQGNYLPQLTLRVNRDIAAELDACGQPEMHVLDGTPSLAMHNGDTYIVTGSMDLSGLTLAAGHHAQVWVMSDTAPRIVWPESWTWLHGSAPDLTGGQNHCIVLTGGINTVIAKLEYSYDRS